MKHLIMNDMWADTFIKIIYKMSHQLGVLVMKNLVHLLIAFIVIFCMKNQILKVA